MRRNNLAVLSFEERSCSQMLLISIGEEVRSEQMFLRLMLPCSAELAARKSSQETSSPVSSAAPFPSGSWTNRRRTRRAVRLMVGVSLRPDEY